MTDVLAPARGAGHHWPARVTVDPIRRPPARHFRDGPVALRKLSLTAGLRAGQTSVAHATGLGEDSLEKIRRFERRCTSSARPLSSHNGRITPDGGARRVRTPVRSLGDAGGALRARHARTLQPASTARRWRSPPMLAQCLSGDEQSLIQLGVRLRNRPKSRYTVSLENGDAKPSDDTARTPQLDTDSYWSMTFWKSEQGSRQPRLAATSRYRSPGI